MDSGNYFQNLNLHQINNQSFTQTKALYFRIGSMAEDEITFFIKHKSSDQIMKTTVIQLENLDMKKIARKYKQTLLLQNQILKAKLSFSIFIPNLENKKGKEEQGILKVVR